MYLSTTTFKLEDDWLYIAGEYNGEMKGEIKGEIKAKKEMAIELKKQGVDLIVISNAAKLPIEEIQNL
jgi:predicted transposase/invertase (TIGR01784 family)